MVAFTDRPLIDLISRDLPNRHHTRAHPKDREQREGTMRWERGGRGLAGTWTGASWLAVALAMAVLVIALVDSAPVIQRARHSMRQASGSAHFSRSYPPPPTQWPQPFLPPSPKPSTLWRSFSLIFLLPISRLAPKTEVVCGPPLFCDWGLQHKTCSGPGVGQRGRGQLHQLLTVSIELDNDNRVGDDGAVRLR